MSTVITRGDLILAPDAVTSVRSERRSQTLVHQVLNRDEADVTLRPATMRTGTIELAYFARATAEEDSAIAEREHAAGGVFTIAAEQRPSLSFSYVCAEGGRIARELDATRGAWLVSIDYQEVRG